MNVKEDSGSALVTVLVLVTALTVLAGSALIALTLHLRLARGDLNRIQAFYHAEAGIYKALWYLSGHDGFDWTWRPRKENIVIAKNKTVQVTVSERGGFLEVVSEVKHRNQLEELRVIVGQAMPDEFNQAIILGGSDFPLVVTGNNRIIGNATVGEGGVKPGSLKGSKFLGERLVEGGVHRVSPPQMPHFDARLFEDAIRKYRDLLQAQSPITPESAGDHQKREGLPGNRILRLQGTVDSKSLSDSLFEGPVTILSQGDLLFSDSIELRQTQIVAKGHVLLTRSARLENAIVFSEKSIAVEGSVAGDLQLITTGDIRVGGQARLEYPSVLFTAGRVVENRSVGSISIADYAKVVGAVILTEPTFERNSSVLRTGQVVVESTADVTGMVFSSNHTTINGRVNGLVVADHFYLYESPTTYINWLKDAHIDRSALSEGFKLPLLFTKRPALEIVTWLQL